MTDTQSRPRNEAAERLREWVMKPTTVWLDAALAEERRHVIEQTKAALADYYRRCDSSPENHLGVFAILDDLSTPERKR